MDEYDSLPNTGALRLGSVRDIASTLIQARIARRLSQEDLARKLHVKAQQIQKYEATQYRSASLQRILDVFQALDLDMEAVLPLRKEA